MKKADQLCRVILDKSIFSTNKMWTWSVTYQNRATTMMLIMNKWSQTVLSPSSSVCHQPQATFLGRQPAIETWPGMFLSTESPKPSCPGRSSSELDLSTNFYYQGFKKYSTTVILTATTSRFWVWSRPKHKHNWAAFIHNFHNIK